MILHGFVPDKFGVGLIVPLVKDKAGDINNITVESLLSRLSPNYSKVFC